MKSLIFIYTILVIAILLAIKTTNIPLLEFVSENNFLRNIFLKFGNEEFNELVTYFSSVAMGFLLGIIYDKHKEVKIYNKQMIKEKPVIESVLATCSAIYTQLNSHFHEEDKVFFPVSTYEAFRVPTKKVLLSSLYQREYLNLQTGRLYKRQYIEVLKTTINHLEESIKEKISLIETQEINGSFSNLLLLCQNFELMHSSRQGLGKHYATLQTTDKTKINTDNLHYFTTPLLEIFVESKKLMEIYNLAYKEKNDFDIWFNDKCKKEVSY